MFVTVTEGIHKLVVKFPKGMGEINSYLIKGAHGYTVIDTGTNSKEAKGTWNDVLDKGIPIEKIVLTHTHQDHIGLAKWFQQVHEIPVYVSDYSYQEMKCRRETNTKKKLACLVRKHGVSNFPEKSENESDIYNFEPNGIFTKDENIKLGDEKYETIWTPGHSWDHFCFYQRNKQLMIIGDHILKDVSPVIGLWTGEEANPLKEYFNSLSLLTNYPTTIALPGHGDPIYHLSDRIEELRKRHVTRLKQVFASVKDEAKTAHQVCYEIYGTTNIILILSSFMATLTRLLYLESMDKVRREEVDGKVTFKAI
ncbi:MULTISPECIES: MBL fold metallo-hydrolase [Virgibacillus]|uniref:MBL fold metallo-hydrolase n=1 Tax=Virgibacillus kapii TaxID=1638645 RepID=A0ABQ2DSA8_9BACI|nr:MULTISPECIES: MBL fold metallo-hydrolase [Virgibacillus]EQB34962.1 hypothetical protein M948_17795 [Virgibacillus sp. CM-4]GGJ70675.1 MBL fold metallo-hydrolase [Virgibacillus kapii]